MDRPKYYPFLPPVPKELLNRQSKTWKERHAKGVPVKMTLEEWRECVMRNYHASGFDIARPAQSVESMSPIVLCCNFHDNDDESSAYFCNFRYKPEWLEKNRK